MKETSAQSHRPQLLTRKVSISFVEQAAKDLEDELLAELGSAAEGESEEGDSETLRESSVNAKHTVNNAPAGSQAIRRISHVIQASSRSRRLSELVDAHTDNGNGNNGPLFTPHIVAYKGDLSRMHALLSEHPSRSFLRELYDYTPGKSLLTQSEREDETFISPPHLPHLVRAALKVQNVNLMSRDQRWLLQNAFAQSSLLHYACAGDQREMVRLLLRQSETDANALNASGKPPEYYTNSDEIREMLWAAESAQERRQAEKRKSTRRASEHAEKLRLSLSAVPLSESYNTTQSNKEPPTTTATLCESIRPFANLSSRPLPPTPRERDSDLVSVQSDVSSHRRLSAKRLSRVLTARRYSDASTASERESVVEREAAVQRERLAQMERERERQMKSLRPPRPAERALPPPPPPLPPPPPPETEDVEKTSEKEAEKERKEKMEKDEKKKERAKRKATEAKMKKESEGLSSPKPDPVERQEGKSLGEREEKEESKRDTTNHVFAEPSPDEEILSLVPALPARPVVTRKLSITGEKLKSVTLVEKENGVVEKLQQPRLQLTQSAKREKKEQLRRSQLFGKPEFNDQGERLIVPKTEKYKYTPPSAAEMEERRREKMAELLSRLVPLEEVAQQTLLEHCGVSEAAARKLYDKDDFMLKIQSESQVFSVSPQPPTAQSIDCETLAFIPPPVETRNPLSLPFREMLWRKAGAQSNKGLYGGHNERSAKLRKETYAEGLQGLKREFRSYALRDDWEGIELLQKEKAVQELFQSLSSRRQWEPQLTPHL